jgi:major membrane immunogen (membrane-anchored lipoprotein)
MAEIESFDKYGWKEFVSIYVSNNNIINVEYNAKNKSGFIKSWDMDYMREMNLASNNYPNKYTRNYINELLTTKNPEVIDAMAGATESYHTFKALSAAAIKQARKGDKNVILIKVEIPD